MQSIVTRGAVMGGCLMLVVSLGACSSSRNMVTVHESTQITKGQELVDLQRAREANALSASEYEQLRRVLMKRPN